MDLPSRKPLRLKTYDYSLPGAYFVTVCTHRRQRLFNAEMFCGRNGTQAVPYKRDAKRNGTQAVLYVDGEDFQTVRHDLCVVPSAANAIIHKWIKETENKFSIVIDRYIIMPDHIHLLSFIEERHVGRSLPDVMRWFKSMATNEYIRAAKAGMLPPFRQKLWQKSYYDHIVRNDEDYEKTWQYIENNPTQFLIDLQNKNKKIRNPFL